MGEDEYRFDADALGRQSASTRVVRAGEFLFREGDTKTGIYRIESGAICAYEAPSVGRSPLLELVFSGDWLGFGYLPAHTRRARAVATTRVSCFPLSLADALVELCPRAKERQADAFEREFEFARRAIVMRDPPNPMQRVAAFLLSLASVSKNEGRDPSIIVESMSCGLIAELLTMSVDTLAAVLVELEKRGLIEPRAPGLRLKDIAALEAVAEGLGLEGRAVERVARLRSIAVDYQTLA